LLRLNYSVQGKNGLLPIYLRISNGRQYDFRIRTQFFIEFENWDEKTNFLKNKKCSRVKSLSIQLNELRERIISSYQRELLTKEINKNWFFDIVNPKKIQNKDRFVDQIKNYISFIKHRVQPSTINKYERLVGLFETFEEEKNTEITVRELNANFGKDFGDFCNRKNYSKNYTAKLFDFILTIWLFAKENGIEVTNDFRKIKFSEEPTDAIFLNQQELNAIRNCDLLNPKLDKVRDWLIIGCFTGARVSDLLNLNKNNISHQYDRETETEIRVIGFTQVKTKKMVWVPLPENGMVDQILKKRNGNFPPKISSQKFNQYLKEVGKNSGITSPVNGSKIDPTTLRKVKGVFPKFELMTSHICRRSFATNYYGRIPTPLLMSITGHSKEADFFKYIRKSPNENIGLIARMID
jgi:hypothetical protein